MTKPRIDISTTPLDDGVIEKGTLMEHNAPPSMLVMVTEVHANGNYFDGVCFDDGAHLAVDVQGNGGWETSEFHIFKGSVTLTQGV